MNWSEGQAVPGNRWDLLDGVVPPEPPMVSVIVAHYRQPEQLARTLHALRRQDHPRDRMEVIVADDGSPEVPTVPDGVRLVRQDDAGFRLAAVRNLGAARRRRRRAGLPRRRHDTRAGVCTRTDATAGPRARLRHGGPAPPRRPRRLRSGEGHSSGRPRPEPSRNPHGSPTGTALPATCWMPMTAATDTSSARSSPARGGCSSRSADSTSPSPPMAARTGSGRTARGSAARYWRTCPRRSRGMTDPTSRGGWRRPRRRRTPRRSGCRS